MEPDDIKNYIQQKITELDKNLDEKEYSLRGRFNFGMNRSHYSHLPSWTKFVKSKKRLLKLIWVEALTTVFFISTFFSGFWNKFDQEWWKIGLITFGMTLFLGAFFVVISFFTTAFESKQSAEKVRRLIYEDLLYKIQEEKKRVN